MRPAPATATATAASTTFTASDTVKWHIDKPANGDAVGASLEVAGWAVDAAAEGSLWSGIEDFEVYLDAPREAGGLRADQSIRHTSRPDVAAALGKASYSSSGFSAAVTLSGVLPGYHSLYIYAKSRASGWRSTQVSVIVPKASVSREEAEQAMLRLSDFPAWYSQKSFGWKYDYLVESDHRPDNVSRSPFVWVSLYVLDDSEAARSFFEMATANMAGYSITPVLLSRVSVSRGYVSGFMAADNQATTNVVKFVLENVFGEVYSTGFAPYNKIDLTANYAQVMVDRLKP